MKPSNLLITKSRIKIQGSLWNYFNKWYKNSFFFSFPDKVSLFIVAYPFVTKFRVSDSAKDRLASDINQIINDVVKYMPIGKTNLSTLLPFFFKLTKFLGKPVLPIGKPHSFVRFDLGILKTMIPGFEFRNYFKIGSKSCKSFKTDGYSVRLSVQPAAHDGMVILGSIVISLTEY